MKKKSLCVTTRALIMFLCVILISNTGLAFANINGHWAKPQIESVKVKNIMPEYTENVFRPNEAVTSLEVLVSIYRSVKATGIIDHLQMGTITTKHEATLKGVGIPPMLAPYGSDTYPALAFALEYKILTLDEVKVFVSGVTLTNVKKVNAIVFYAKALNVFKVEDLNKIILLSYKDAAEIPLSAIKYVNLLIEKGLITSKGDSLGNFNPNDTVTRATLAVLAEGLYNQLSSGQNQTIGGGGTPEVPVTTQPTTENTVSLNVEKVVTGTVSAVYDDLLKVEVTGLDGKSEVYSLENVMIKAGTETTSFENIVVNTAIELNVKNNVVTEVKIDKILARIEGEFVQLTDYIGASKLRRSLKIVLPNKTFDFRSVYDSTLITIDGKTAKPEALKANYKIILLHDGYDVKRIIAYSELYEFYGMLKAPIDIKSPTVLEASLDTGNVFKGDISKGVSFIKVDQNLVAGDLVKVSLKYGVVQKIEYVGTAKTLVGKLSGIHIKATPELTFAVTNKEETYNVSSRLKIFNESGTGTLSIYDLRLDQEVTVDIGIGGVTKVQMGRKLVSEPTGLKTTVTQVLESSNLLLVTDESNRLRTVTLPSNQASLYRVGMVIYIEGKALTETIFEATKITIQTP